MPKSDYDFSGYATRFNVRCSDGRTIRPGAFDDCDGMRVPLVYMHDHMSPTNVLGHADLECRPDGVYCYAKCNDTEPGQHSLESVKNGDLTAFSIYANKLKQHGADVVHGAIREVSLVLGGANPRATIDTVLAHDDWDGEDEAAVMQFDDSAMILAHSDEEDRKNKKKPFVESDETDDKDDVEVNEDPEDESEEPDEDDAENQNGKKEDKMAYNNLCHADEDVEQTSGDDKTVQDVIDSMTEEQKNVLYALVGMAAEQGGAGSEEDDVKHNLFDEDDNYLAHSIDFDQFMRGSKAAGSVKQYLQSDEDMNDALAHSEEEFGIEQIDTLFPDFHNLTNTPQFVSREMGWVSKVWNSVSRTPFSRIRTVFADITEDEARAKGYIKGNRKKEEVFKLLKRTTDPQTVYKKQKFHRDDVTDITDFDVVAWVKGEMRTMLDEELSRAVLVGDGRTELDEDHISTDHIRPIWGDDPFYTIRAQVGFGTDVTEDDKYWNIIKAAIKSRKDYRGSGDPVMFTTEDNLTGMLLLENQIGDLKFKSKEELASRMRVSDIITVPVMDGLTRTASKTDGDAEAADGKALQLEALIVNLKDYNVGADKGGAVNMFDDFDIDYNQMIYLIETRCSGCMIKPYGAIAIESYETGTTGKTVSTDVEVGDPSTQSSGAK
jgi:HK97 family phage prohead protease